VIVFPWEVGVELRQLRYFVAVAEELHFGRAAQRLHIVQPAVSQQIRRLERELGVTLLDRTPRRVTLTPSGQRLLAEARTVLAAADRTAAVAAELALGEKGSLRVGTSPGLTARLQRGLHAIRLAVPDLPVELDNRPGSEQLAAVARGDLDLALVRGIASWPGLQVVELAREPLVAAVPAAHPLAGRAAVSLPDLATLPVRLPARECDPLFHDWMLAACREAGVTPQLGRPALSPPDTLVELGAGAPAWAPLYVDPTTVTGIGQVALLPLDPVLELPIALAVPENRPPSCVTGLRAAFGQ
jgi:DNA-binding transcriptional LysR family regulator